MQTIEPARLTILTRPYQWRGSVRLGIGIYVLAQQNSDVWHLLDDQELWSNVLPELDSNGILDQIMPKSNPEYLISGFAYTNNQNTKDVCIVKAEVGELQKSLLVIGDRYWIGNEPTKPQPFSRLPITWNNAFGGDGHEKNPAGKGVTEVELGKEKAIPLPNIENPTHRISKKEDKPEPVSFGPIGSTHPDRLSMLGTYSEEWFKYDFPGFLPDMKPGIFNMASDDQQWQSVQSIPDRTSFKIWNMHPGKACWDGTLPSLTARAFIKKEKNGASLQEVDNITLSTAWFLPERDSVILMFHGSTEIEDEDADDIAVVMGAIESEKDRRPLTHYQDVCALRLDPESSLDYVSDDSQLVSKTLINSPKESIDYSPDKNKLSIRIDKFLQTQEQETTRTLEQHGIKEDDLYGQFVGPEINFSSMTDQEQKEYFQKSDRAANDQLKEIINQFKAENPRGAVLLNDIEKSLNSNTDTETLEIPVSGPPDLSHFDMPASSVMGTPEEQAKFDEQKQRLKGYARKSYLYTAQYQTAATRPMPEQDQLLRQALLTRYSQSKDLTKMDMTGVKLNGLTFEDADFSESFFENSIFSNCTFKNVNFSEAVLTRGHFTNCSFESGNFARTNLAKAKLEKCKLLHCSFLETEIENSQMSDSAFKKCKFEMLTPTGFQWTEIEFTGCDFVMCILDEGKMERSNFFTSDIFKTIFENSTLEKIEFNKSTLKDSTFSSSTCNECSFNECTLNNVMFEEDSPVLASRFLNSYLQECNFMETKLHSIQFYKCNLTGSDFTKSQLQNCNFDHVVARDTIFYKSDLTGSSFRYANLIQATLEKANLAGCDFTGATLFRTNVSKVKLSPETKFDGAFRDQLEVYPIHRDQLNVNALFTNE
jgi:uncharacterized protein YjbI with pentapeptide repeats